jgi:hypothetical protein
VIMIAGHTIRFDEDKWAFVCHTDPVLAILLNHHVPLLEEIPALAGAWEGGLGGYVVAQIPREFPVKVIKLEDVVLPSGTVI